jgi:hypothetical protein
MSADNTQISRDATDKRNAQMTLAAAQRHTIFTGLRIERLLRLMRVICPAVTA